MRKAIALIDANNFYATCEQSLDPSLMGRAVVVLSNNDGCIVARSAQARALGIAMGTPYFKVKAQLEQCGVIVRSSNYALYGDMSQRLMSLIKAEVEELEIYSIDEAFASLSRPTNGTLKEWAQQLRMRIRRNLGLTVAIGLGNSKGQAKLANQLAKTLPSQACIFDLGLSTEADQWLESIAIEKVWGIGRKLAIWCRQRGVTNALLLRDMPSKELQAKCGVVGLRLQRELHGETCLDLEKDQRPKQETCVSRSFSRGITTREELEQAVATFVVRAAEKLRSQEQRAGAITVFTRTNPFMSSFYSRAESTKLNMPSNDTADLLAAAGPLVKTIYRQHKVLTKAGVIMQDLQGTSHLQHHLLSDYDIADLQRRERLMQTVDQLNQHYGHNTVRWAKCGLEQRWLMRRQQLSHASTTRLNDIPIAKAQ